MISKLNWLLIILNYVMINGIVKRKNEHLVMLFDVILRKWIRQ